MRFRAVPRRNQWTFWANKGIRKSVSEAHNRQDKPLFAKSIDGHSLSEQFKPLIGGIMGTAITASGIQREPELLGQTVVVIGGSVGVGLET